MLAKKTKRGSDMRWGPYLWEIGRTSAICLEVSSGLETKAMEHCEKICLLPIVGRLGAWSTGTGGGEHSIRLRNFGMINLDQCSSKKESLYDQLRLAGKKKKKTLCDGYQGNGS